MELATIARPYAEALFRVARKEDLSRWAALVTELAAIGANSDIQGMAANPRLDKRQIVDVLLSLVKSEGNQELKNFVEVLVENDRVNILPEIGQQFRELKNASEGAADATVISAFPMADDQLADLLKTLEKHFLRKLNVTAISVDNSLIGGVIVTVGDEVMDLSVRAKLQRMQEKLVS